MKQRAKADTGLIPPDRTRCQAEVPNGHSFMTLGGHLPGRARCDNRPSVIVVEQVPGKDGKRGSMSLCERCLGVFRQQIPKIKVAVERL